MQIEILESVELDSWLDLIGDELNNTYGDSPSPCMSEHFVESLAHQINLLAEGKEMSFSARLRALANLLRSGEIRQIGSVLNRRGSMCASGVACELFSRHYDYAEWIYDREIDCMIFSLEKRFNYLHQSSMYTPEKVRYWYGVGPEFFACLVEMNDSNMTFDEIADWIDHTVDDMDFSGLDAMINWASGNIHLAM